MSELLSIYSLTFIQSCKSYYVTFIDSKWLAEMYFHEEKKGADLNYKWSGNVKWFYVF